MLVQGRADHLPDKLIEELLPGPVTIVVKKSIHLNNPYLNNGIEKIGIRIPDFDFIRDVCRYVFQYEDQSLIFFKTNLSFFREFSQPVALTSANRSSEKSSLNIDEFKHLWSSLGAIFDGGPLSDSEEHRKGSTVIDLSRSGKYRVIREGIACDATIKIVENYGIKPMY